MRRENSSRNWKAIAPRTRHTLSFRMTWGQGPDGALGLAVQGAIVEVFEPEKELRGAEELIETDFDRKPTELVIDPDGVKRFNSIGVKKWVEFMNRLQESYSVRFAVLPSAFIEMARMIPAVLGKSPARVAGFRVPYACTHCHTYFSVIGQVAALGRDGTWQEFKKPCEKCGKQAELDALAAEYFWFLKLCERSLIPMPTGEPASRRPSGL